MSEELQNDFEESSVIDEQSTHCAGRHRQEVNTPLPLRLACAYGCQAAINAVDRVARLANTTANRMDSPLELCLRDAYPVVAGPSVAVP